MKPTKRNLQAEVQVLQSLVSLLGRKLGPLAAQRGLMEVAVEKQLTISVLLGGKTL